MTTKYFLLFTFLVSYHFLVGQSGLVSSGGQAKSSVGSISYSIGQTDYLSVSSTAGSISQGLQQPFEISEIVGIEDQSFATPVSIYPNPTSGNITLQMEEEHLLNDLFTLSIFDANGHTVGHQIISTSIHGIDISHVNTGIYIFRITNSSNHFRTFKIIKK